MDKIKEYVDKLKAQQICTNMNTMTKKKVHQECNQVGTALLKNEKYCGSKCQFLNPVAQLTVIQNLKAAKSQ